MAELVDGGTYYLYWAIAVTIILVILAILVVRQRRMHETDMQEMDARLQEKQSKSFTLGRSGIRGELAQILGSFALLNEYNQLALLSSVSKQFSLDLIGIKDDSVDFIEIKTEGTPLSTSEKKVKKLIDEKKVDYRIIEGNIPKFFEIRDRED